MRFDGFPFASLRAMSMISISDALYTHNTLALTALLLSWLSVFSCNLHLLAGNSIEAALQLLYYA